VWGGVESIVAAAAAAAPPTPPSPRRRLRRRRNRRRGGRKGEGLTGETMATRYCRMPLQMLWARFPHFDWKENNTLMVDDTDKTFALSLGNGVKFKEFRMEVRKGAREGGREGGREELVWLGDVFRGGGKGTACTGESRAVHGSREGRRGERREGRGVASWRVAGRDGCGVTSRRKEGRKEGQQSKT